MTRQEARAHVPTVIRVDERNRPTGDTSVELPGPILNSLDRMVS
jgi:hypothetical protein